MNHSVLMRLGSMGFLTCYSSSPAVTCHHLQVLPDGKTTACVEHSKVGCEVCFDFKEQVLKG